MSYISMADFARKYKLPRNSVTSIRVRDPERFPKAKWRFNKYVLFDEEELVEYFRKRGRKEVLQ